MAPKKYYKTIIAPLKFNLLASLSTDDLLERGHRPMSITVIASKRKADTKKDVVRIPIPKTVGHGVDGRQLNATKVFSNETRVHKIYITKLSENGIEELKKFVARRELNGLSFTVKELVTENKENGQWIKWSRMPIKNGTKAHALCISEIDDVPFTELKWEQIVSAVDDMVFDACQFEKFQYECFTPECKTH